ncbi:MAG: hypothetical protein NC187_06060 [Candidatus Amulumruptor caecigallinarius]|nr:hypothetical protein [Candidatus Amulumruptor caecigallinarius]MCM1397034.1 hypothetical protein [Candidatus Amulumruptor caecigallinarius]MCM1454030.1 hypothetical protein [bacterium]
MAKAFSKSIATDRRAADGIRPASEARAATQDVLREGEIPLCITAKLRNFRHTANPRFFKASWQPYQNEDGEIVRAYVMATI